MPECITSLLKIFLEKYLISTIVAVLGAIVVMAFTPEEYWLFQKLGTWYYIGIFCAMFLLIQFCSLCIKTGILKIHDIQQNKQDEEEACEKIMTFFDTCSPIKKNIAKKLLDGKNTPIVLKDFHEIYEVEDCLWNNNFYITGLRFEKTVKFKEFYYKRLKRIYSKYGRLSHFDESK